MRPFEQLSELEQKKKRKYEAKALRKASERGFIKSADVANWPDRISADPNFSGKYGQLAEQLFLRFIPSVASADLEAVVKQSTLHGFYVATAMLKYAPKAYVDFKEGSTVEQSVKELGTILRRSLETPLMFSRMQNRANRTYEANFGIGTMPNYEPQPFIINTDDADGLDYFVPSPLTLELSEDDVARRYVTGGLLPQMPHRRCPGPIKFVWDEAIAFCQQDPNLFQFDLNQLADSGQASIK